MGAGRFLGGGDVQQSSKELRMSPSKDRGTHSDKGQGESTLVPVPLCFSEVVSERQRREGEADDDEEGVSGRTTSGIPGSNREPLKVIGRSG